MKTSLLQIRLTDDEKEKITNLAGQSSFKSISEYVRARALNRKIESRFDYDVAIELLKINADLSRLGNLLRLSIKESNKYDAEQIQLIQRLLQETCQTIKEKVISL